VGMGRKVCVEARLFWVCLIAAPEICYMRMYLLKYFKTKVGLFIFKQIGTGSKNQLITFFNCKSLKTKAIKLQKIRKLVKK